REAARKICAQRYREFGCEGQASKIKPMDLASVAKRYANGELAPSVS
ncbi:MAG: fructose-1,6-bisphosphate aldolase, partial [Rubrivivax sp.]